MATRGGLLEAVAGGGGGGGSGGGGGGGSGGGGGGSTLAAAADAEEGGGEEGGGAAPSGDVGSAARHLARARRELPDSTLYAACEAQLLSHAGRLDQAHAVLLDAADAGLRSAPAEEMILRWLERHQPHERAAAWLAAERLLEADPASDVAERVLDEMALAAASPLPAAPGEELPLLGRLLAMSAARVEAFAR
mmetsp:Transcript_15558/g.50932  ORF Transcript_15558/g.50932 Transcript_15558/m.50932 type:complete len:193 (+) Transcript_15558:1012-1590(+)